MDDTKLCKWKYSAWEASGIFIMYEVRNHRKQKWERVALLHFYFTYGHLQLTLSHNQSFTFNVINLLMDMPQINDAFNDYNKSVLVRGRVKEAASLFDVNLMKLPKCKKADMRK